MSRTVFEQLPNNRVTVGKMMRSSTEREIMSPTFHAVCSVCAQDCSAHAQIGCHQSPQPAVILTADLHGKVRIPLAQLMNASTLCLSAVADVM